MTRLLSMALVTTMLVSTACSETTDTSQADVKADLIVINGDVRTVDPESGTVEAFAVKDSWFLAVGSNADIEKFKGPETEIIDAKGASIVPGLIDGHSHLTYGLNLIRGVDLYGVAERDEWLDKIKKRSDQLPPGEWLTGGRWDHTLAGDPLPTKEELDAIVSDRPVYLNDVDGHSAWANSMALELAGVTRDSVSPEGGKVVKDPTTGEPTGILFETAKTLITESTAYKDGTFQRDDDRQFDLG